MNIPAAISSGVPHAQEFHIKPDSANRGDLVGDLWLDDAVQRRRQEDFFNIGLKYAIAQVAIEHHDPPPGTRPGGVTTQQTGRDGCLGKRRCTFVRFAVGWQ